MRNHLPGLGIPLAVAYFMIRREQCGVVKALSGSPGPVRRKNSDIFGTFAHPRSAMRRSNCCTLPTVKVATCEGFARTTLQWALHASTLLLKCPSKGLLFLNVGAYGDATNADGEHRRRGNIISHLGNGRHSHLQFADLLLQVHMVYCYH